MKALIRHSVSKVPVLHASYCWARRHYHELRTRRAAMRYFVNYDVYRDALHSDGQGTVEIRTADGLTIAVRRNQWDARVLQEVFLNRPYLRHVTIGAGATVVDIGGYIGDFALYAARCLDARRVITYEPSPRNFSLLLRNVRANGHEDRIVAVNKAVGDGGELKMNVDLPDRKQVNVSAFGPAGSAPPVSIPAVTLEQLMETHGLDTIDLLKIDCEGGEYAILSSAPPAVLRRIRNIVFEYHEIEGFAPLLQGVEAQLEAEGFTLTAHDGDMMSASRP